MNLWSVRFTDMASTLQSARVAAPDKEMARDLMDEHIDPARDKRIIIDIMGSIDVPEPGIIEIQVRPPV